MDIGSLIENVDRQIIETRTKSLDVSLNELYDMYLNEELLIAPDYQRLFRWGEEKQSRFIESLILEMPVPPIYVVELELGIYELIDGLQRISSYFHFRGKNLICTNRNGDFRNSDFLNNNFQNNDLQDGYFQKDAFHYDDFKDGGSQKGASQGTDSQDFLCLQGCDIVPELNGLTFNDLPTALQIKIKRRFIRMEIVKKERAPELNYHIFKRLKTGGELLSAQEIRNSTIRFLGTEGIEFIKECSHNPDFVRVITRVDEDKLKTLYAQELVLRFFAIKNDIENYRAPVTEYLTRFLEHITLQKSHFDYDIEGQIFKYTFRFINEYLGDEIFLGSTTSGSSKNEFVLYYFDSIALAIALLIDQINGSNSVHELIARINDIKFGAEIQAYKTDSVEDLKSRIKLFKDGIREVLERQAT